VAHACSGVRGHLLLLAGEGRNFMTRMLFYIIGKYFVVYATI